MRTCGQALVQSDWCPYKKEEFGHRDSRGMYEQDICVTRQQEECYLQAKERPRGKTGPTSALNLDSQTLGLYEN